MQMAITFMAVVGGLMFSLGIALLAEELIFGQLFRLFFSPRKLARQTAEAKVLQKTLSPANELGQGERQCWR